MKWIIKYYYGIEIENYDSDKMIYSFLYFNEIFYFVPYYRDKKSLDSIIKMSKTLKESNVRCHDIILNKFDKVLTEFNNGNYILLKVNRNYKNEIDIFDMFFINKKSRLNVNENKIYRVNWKDMWSKNINYYESQIRNYGKNKSGILNSFSYYLGLAENAIEYLNIIEKDIQLDLKKDFMNVSHRRIFSPNYQLNFLNPISFIFDLEIRDYAEYFKSSFFYNEPEIVYQELISFLRILDVGTYSFNMFFARLIYPSYYFDLFEKIILNELNMEELIKIVNKQKEYEKFLTFVYYEISKYANLKKIPWLVS